jgi:WhiB family redox-sensing transcriptional regulator
MGDWRDAAACRDLDPDLFFPPGTGHGAPGQVAEAKLVCMRCPVLAPCLRWALAAEAQYGIWGGTTEDERLRLRIRAERPGRSTEPARRRPGPSAHWIGRR